MCLFYNFNERWFLISYFPRLPFEHIWNEVEFILSLFDDLWDLAEIQSGLNFGKVFSGSDDIQTILHDFLHVDAIRRAFRNWLDCVQRRIEQIRQRLTSHHLIGQYDDICGERAGELILAMAHMRIVGLRCVHLGRRLTFRASSSWVRPTTPGSCMVASLRHGANRNALFTDVRNMLIACWWRSAHYGGVHLRRCQKWRWFFKGESGGVTRGYVCNNLEHSMFSIFYTLAIKCLWKVLAD